MYCSEFEELEAVPTMAVMDGPLEPSSTARDAPNDPAFVNFFSVRLLRLLIHIHIVAFIIMIASYKTNGRRAFYQF